MWATAAMPGSGIIPADAGSTWCYVVGLHKAGDHPRRCGEHTTRGILNPIDAGSSPQMRGALDAGVAR